LLGRLWDVLRDFFRKGDMFLLSMCLISSVFGLALIYSATRYDPALHSCVVKQAMFICMGIVIYMIFTLVDIELILERSWKLLVLAGILLILMLIPFGVEGDTGNRSWMYLPGIPIGIQPAELVKIPFILVMGRILDQNREHGLSHPVSVLISVGYTFLFAGLIAVLSEDYGMVLVYLLLFVFMSWTAGVARRWFVLGGVAVGSGFGLIAFLSVRSERFMNKFGYIIRRFTEAYTRSDPQGVGWQQTRSILAIGSGQLTGQGFLKGNLTQSIYESSLPARHTDEIFAVCGEELGLLGCLAVLLLIFAIFLRCLWVARASRSYLSAYIASGFAAMLLIQTVINIAMCLYLFPVVGLTLPFFSYGGSSILTLYACMGIISGIKTRFLPRWLKDRSNL